MLVTISEATKDGVQHCNDKMRGLIENSCKTIMSAHKQRQEMYDAYPSIVKRENDFEPEYYVEYLDGECKSPSTPNRHHFPHFSMPTPLNTGSGQWNSDLVSFI